MRAPERRDRARCRVFFCGTERSSDRRQGLYGTEFTYKFVSEAGKNPVDRLLEKWGIKHILIPPRTPWHNGKVERSHRNDQRYFYDWEHFCSVEELNEKLKAHLEWSNNKTMRTLGRKSPIQLLREKLGALVSPRALKPLHCAYGSVPRLQGTLPPHLYLWKH